MPDREKYIEVLSKTAKTVKEFNEDIPIKISLKCIEDILELLKEQEERLRKLQKDKDKLCLEISEWKHKFHDAPPKFVSQGVVDQICWERDTALSQLEQIGKGLGSKMDDIVALLKEQEAVEPIPFHRSDGTIFKYECRKCRTKIFKMDLFCRHCGTPVLWER